MRQAMEYDYDFINPLSVPHRPMRTKYDTFAATERPGHGANDLYPVTLPASIVAAADGKIRFTGMGSDLAGGLVETLHPTGAGWFCLRKMHMEYIRLPVGASILQGDYLGEVAHSTSPQMGNANAPHLHFEIRYSPYLEADQWTMYGSHWGVRLDPELFNFYDPDTDIMEYNASPPKLEEIRVDRPVLRRQEPPYVKDQATQEVQYLLAVRGFLDLTASTNFDMGTLTFDGKFGPSTEQAVRNYQISKGLVADGIVGASTWTVILDY